MVAVKKTVVLGQVGDYLSQVFWGETDSQLVGLTNEDGETVDGHLGWNFRKKERRGEEKTLSRQNGSGRKVRPTFTGSDTVIREKLNKYIEKNRLGRGFGVRQETKTTEKKFCIRYWDNGKNREEVQQKHGVGDLTRMNDCGREIFMIASDKNTWELKSIGGDSPDVDWRAPLGGGAI